MELDKRVEELVSADLDGELSPGEKAELKGILAASEEARALRESYLQDREQLRSLPTRALPPELEVKIKQKAARRPSPAARRGLYAAAIIMLGLLAWWVLRPSDHSRLYLAAGKLSQRPWTAADATVVEGPEPIVLESPRLWGEYSGRPTACAIRVDGGPRSAVSRARVSYDFDGDGEFDHSQSFVPFSTDSAPGWETYGEVLESEPDRGWRDLEGGTVRLELWADGEVGLQLLQGGEPEESSWLQLPFRNLRQSPKLGWLEGGATFKQRSSLFAALSEDPAMIGVSIWTA